MKEFRCPNCQNIMQQESQHQHKVIHVSDSYNRDTKEWIIPEYFLIQFERRFWCVQDSCSLRNKYIFVDGNYKYKLERIENE